jgi:hypothetical protein
MDGDEDEKHFLGPLVCTPSRTIPGEVTAYQIIDGQQRLTTLTLALAALRDVARLNDLKDFGDAIQEDYLVHRRRQGLQRFKVVPRLEDRRTYELVIDGAAPGAITGTGIIGCHSFFKRAWKTPVANGGEEAARRILVALTSRLSLVSITVDGENPYEIFASLNGEGLPLEEADLIRNFLFMQVPLAEQAQFHASQWQAFEDRFGRIGRYERVPPTPFYRNYLMRDGRYSRKGTTYVEFKRQNIDRRLTATDQVSELQRFATFELWLQRPELCEREYLRDRLAEIQQLAITTAHPLLLHLLNRHDQGTINRSELDDCLRDLASFVIRRTICGESTRAYGRWFPEAIPAILNHPSVNLRRYWLDKGWPDDAAFIAGLAKFPIYVREGKKCRHLLERLEKEHGHHERVEFDRLTIEHVLPQTLANDEAGRSWRAMLGEAWGQEHEKWLHTLGNLTLTGYNPELSNNAFAEKRRLFAESNVSLNAYFGSTTNWGGREIEQRGLALARVIARMWPRPTDGPGYRPGAPDADDLFPPTVEPPPPPNSPRAPHVHGSLQIVIRWSMLGVDDADQTVSEATDGLSYAALLGLLISRYDNTLTEKLQQIPVARGHRLSANPDLDFINRNTGVPYSKAPVPGTGLFVCTSSSKNDKKRDIRRLIRDLDLPAGSIEAL